MGKKNPKLFGVLFRQFRLRAGFVSLASFGQTLAEHGLVYEDSTLSRWQNGSRVPAQRTTLITIIYVLSQNRGISTTREANRLLEAAEQGYLTNEEEKELPMTMRGTAPFQAPPNIESFIGRQNVLAELKKRLLRSNVVLISGTAGVGKTALAIRLAHMVKNDFPDGVLWSRLDTTSPASILAKIAYTYGENIYTIKNIEARAEIVRSLLNNKSALLVFDNAASSAELQPLLPNSPLCGVVVTSRLKSIDIPQNTKRLELCGFTRLEMFEFFIAKTNRQWTRTNKQSLLKIWRILGQLPLAIDIAAGHMAKLPSEHLQRYVRMLNREKSRLGVLKSEETSVQASFNTSFNALQLKHKKLFVVLGVFEGLDFSLQAAAAAAGIREKEALMYLEDLHDRSMVERSSNSRYRLHTLMRVYAKEKIKSKKPYINTAQYFIESFRKLGLRGSGKTYQFIECEFDNILGIFKRCYLRQEWKLVIELWEYFGIYLWDRGYWDDVIKQGERVYTATKKVKDALARAKLCIRLLSWAYFWQGELKKAKLNAQEGLKLAQCLNDKYLTAYARQRLGKVYQAEGLYQKSLALFSHSMQTFKKLNENERVGDTLTYLGETYSLMGKTSRAKQYLEKALAFVSRINDFPQKAIIDSRLGGTALVEGDYKKAKMHFTESLRFEQEHGRRAGGAVWNNIGLGIVKFETGKRNIARRHFQKAKKEMQYLGIGKNTEKLHAFIKEKKDVLRRTGF